MQDAQHQPIQVGMRVYAVSDYAPGHTGLGVVWKVTADIIAVLLDNGLNHAYLPSQVKPADPLEPQPAGMPGEGPTPAAKITRQLRDRFDAHCRSQIREELTRMAPEHGEPAIVLYARWRAYCEACKAKQQHASFVAWKASLAPLGLLVLGDEVGQGLVNQPAQVVPLGRERGANRHHSLDKFIIKRHASHRSIALHWFAIAHGSTCYTTSSTLS
jgi:hypothetical protein